MRVPILGDASVVENQIVDLKARIGEVEELLKTRSRMWQKFHRPDDMLPSKEIERLKREEKAELKELQAQVRALQERLRNWGTHKEDYNGETEEWIDMTFADKHPDLILSETTPVFGWIPRLVEVRVMNAKGGYDTVEDFKYHAGGYHDHVDARYNIENYRKLIAMGSDALELVADGLGWGDNWTRWENAAICVAISEGLIQPDMEIVSRHPGLARWSVIKEDMEHEHTVVDHEAERIHAIKTGGGSLGGARIYARGWRYGKRSGKWSMRGIESFDATARYRPKDAGDRTEYAGEAGDRIGRGFTNDDAESYDPR